MKEKLVSLLIKATYYIQNTYINIYTYIYFLRNVNICTWNSFKYSCVSIEKYRWLALGKGVGMELWCFVLWIHILCSSCYVHISWIRNYMHYILILNNAIYPSYNFRNIKNYLWYYIFRKIPSVHLSAYLYWAFCTFKGTSII